MKSVWILIVLVLAVFVVLTAIDIAVDAREGPSPARFVVQDGEVGKVRGAVASLQGVGSLPSLIDPEHTVIVFSSFQGLVLEEASTGCRVYIRNREETWCVSVAGSAARDGVLREWLRSIGVER